MCLRLLLVQLDTLPYLERRMGMGNTDDIRMEYLIRFCENTMCACVLI